MITARLPEWDHQDVLRESMTQLILRGSPQPIETGQNPSARNDRRRDQYLSDCDTGNYERESETEHGKRTRTDTKQHVITGEGGQCEYPLTHGAVDGLVWGLGCCVMLAGVYCHY